MRQARWRFAESPGGVDRIRLKSGMNPASVAIKFRDLARREGLDGVHNSPRYCRRCHFSPYFDSRHALVRISDNTAPRRRQTR